MTSSAATPVPTLHTAEGGVLVGDEGAPRQLVLFEDPQCPYCRQFEEASGDLLRGETAAGAVVVEYRMRCFLGVESVRADNALALAAEEGRFDELRRELFAHQPAEQSGGFTVADLIDLGARIGLTSPEYVNGIREGRYEAWVIAIDRVPATGSTRDSGRLAPRSHGEPTIAVRPEGVRSAVDRQPLAALTHPR